MNPGGGKKDKDGKDSKSNRRSIYGKTTSVSHYTNPASPRGKQSVYTGAGQLRGPQRGPVPDLLPDGTALQYLQSRQFKVIGKLGEGNYAQVMRVRGLDNKDVAVKIIDLAKCSLNYRTNFFPREVEVMGKMKHKNITEIYEIQKVEDTVLIFMEYASNGTVADFIHAHKAMPEFIAKPIIAQLVEALFYLHTTNIAHRDMKVENILLDKSMNPKLTDFSYSTFIKFDDKKEVIKTKTFCGSVVYIPPEILNERAYDPRQADIWSFGVCVYVMVNNTIPFKVNNLVEFKQKQLNKDWSFKSYVQVSKELKEVVAKMLEPDPATRITSKDLLLHPYFTKK